ncbi:MAG: hypothetical protein M3O36_17575 [Myxococcota bacterium]|nr:hypothetical protein [Myxococcota bacterium]
MNEVPACPAGALGDLAKPLDFRIQALLADQSVAPVEDGAAVPLLFPPQGGRVLFIGVRATNVDGCALRLTGALRDPSSQQVRFETRSINLIPTGDGWGQSGVVDATHGAAISNFANVPVCPNQWASGNVYDQPYRLEVTVEDRQGARKLTKFAQVTPVCAEPANAAQCSCICKAGYILGQACDQADATATATADGGDAN